MNTHRRYERKPILARKRRVQPQEVWIGLVQVSQRDRTGPLGDADQAFTNALALARSRTGFRSEVRKALEGLGLELLRLEEAEPMKTRMAKYKLGPELRRLAAEVKANGSPKFDTFHSFDLDDSNRQSHNK